MAKQSNTKAGKSVGTGSIKSATAITVPESASSHSWGTNHSGAQDVIAGRQSDIATSGDFLPSNKRLNNRS